MNIKKERTSGLSGGKGPKQDFSENGDVSRLLNDWNYFFFCACFLAVFFMAYFGVSAGCRFANLFENKCL